MTMLSTLVKHKLDWILAITLCFYSFFIGENIEPFPRQFDINSSKIQFPYAESQTISDLQCLIIATIIPTITISTFILVRHPNIKSHLQGKRFEFLHSTFLAFALSIAINAFITITLKNWISYPRPDFISRCLPDPTKIIEDKNLYTLDICTQEDKAFLLEGLRSSPSGHSSFAFVGLNFLSLWLAFQLNIFGNKTSVWKSFLVILPELLALFVAISRTQDYRHSFLDVTFGSLLGITISTISYYKFFKFGKDAAYLQEVEYLPLYNERSA